MSFPTSASIKILSITSFHLDYIRKNLCGGVYKTASLPLPLHLLREYLPPAAMSIQPWPLWSHGYLPQCQHFTQQGKTLCNPYAVPWNNWMDVTPRSTPPPPALRLPMLNRTPLTQHIIDLMKEADEEQQAIGWPNAARGFLSLKWELLVSTTHPATFLLTQPHDGQCRIRNLLHERHFSPCHNYLALTN